VHYVKKFYTIWEPDLSFICYMSAFSCKYNLYIVLFIIFI